MIVKDGKVKLSDKDITAIISGFKTSSRENDPWPGLIDAVANNREGVPISKHHIIPESEIRDDLKKVATYKPDVLKKKMQSFINNKKNTDMRTKFIYCVGGNVSDPGQVMKWLAACISWNPNNLRFGPANDIRANDPGAKLDREVATKMEQSVATNRSLDILEKQTKLHTSKNPTWSKKFDAKKPWGLNQTEGCGHNTQWACRQGTGDHRRINIETGNALNIVGEDKYEGNHSYISKLWHFIICR